MKQKIIIIDLGGEDLIGLARKIREMGVYSEIHPHTLSLKNQADLEIICGIIFAGPSKKPLDFAVKPNAELLANGLPRIGLSCPDLGIENHPTWNEQLLDRFLFRDCGCKGDWNIEGFIKEQTASLREKIGSEKVILALSGGVDSSVVAALLLKAVKDQVTFIHVNNGLMRKGESEEVLHLFKDGFGAQLIYVDATERFLNKLRDVADPEEKRKIIGNEFIRIFEEEAAKLKDARFLAQGTIYPDIIESGTLTAQTVKSHHNVGGLPEDMDFTLIEPIRQLFKDEVRAVGLALGLPSAMVNRQPFPGPGLGVRCLGKITKERLTALRESDAILHEEFEKAGIADQIWQYFTVVPEFKSVGVRDQKRTFEYPVIIRAVHTVDAMTATIAHPDWSLLDKITRRIVDEVPGVNRVCYDLTPKPTGTIEWE